MSPGIEKQINEQLAMNLPPENILRHMSPEDRAKYGKAGLTKDEAERVYTDGEEKELQRHCVELLTQRGVRCVICPPMHRRSQLPEGWPDLTFCWQGKPCAVECKTTSGRLSEDQEDCGDDLVEDGWHHDVVRSLREFQMFLDDLTS
jgi:hypothetical protein